MKIIEILQRACEAKASDIHMVQDCPVMLRIHGKMNALEEDVVQASDIEEWVAELLTEMQLMELKKTGDIDTAVTIPGFSRVRANVYKQRGSYAIAIRLLSSIIPSPQELEVPDAVWKLTKENKGLILITGEAGNGKTTTIVSLLQEIAQNETKNIITIENPIEYMLPNGKSIVSQREIGSDTLSYAAAVKSALRQDPDVIFVDELSDAETILEVLAAAEAGHLVFSSLYTKSTEDTLNRLIDVFPVHRRQQIRVQLASVLKGVIAQQLLPRSDENSRSAVFEIMLMDKEIQALLTEDRIAQIHSALENKKDLGMQTMDDAILSAYMKCRITNETAISYAVDTENMRKMTQIY